MQNYQIVMTQLPLCICEPHGQIKTPADIRSACSDIANLAQEAFHALTLDAKNGLLNRHLITLGTANASLVHPREVFRPAITDGACAIALVHNHPSGDTTPSSEDLRTTSRLVAAGKVLDIAVVDHVIITRDGMLSMRENNMISFAD